MFPDLSTKNWGMIQKILCNTSSKIIHSYPDGYFLIGDYIKSSDNKDSFCGEEIVDFSRYSRIYLYDFRNNKKFKPTNIKDKASITHITRLDTYRFLLITEYIKHEVQNKPFSKTTSTWEKAFNVYNAKNGTTKILTTLNTDKNVSIENVFFNKEKNTIIFNYQDLIDLSNKRGGNIYPSVLHNAIYSYDLSTKQLTQITSLPQNNHLTWAYKAFIYDDYLLFINMGVIYPTLFTINSDSKNLKEFQVF